MRAPRTLLTVIGLSLAAFAARAQGGIETIAGGGPGDGSPALAVNLRTPQDVVRDAAGNTYIAVSDDRRVYRIGTDGTIALVAGSGGAGSFGDGGPATKAGLVSPKGLAFDTDGNLLIADEGGRRIRRVDLAAGKISTLVGGGSFTGEGIAALQIMLDAPRDVVVAPGGNVFIADGHRVRRLDRATGLVSTVAGTGTAGFSDGSPAASRRLNEPRALALDPSGAILIADGGNGRIRKLVLATDTISTLVNGICSPGGVAADAGGVVYFNSNTGGGCGSSAQKYQKWVSGSVSTIGATGSSFVAQMSVLTGGTLLVADRDNYRAKTVSPSGTATNLAGNGTIGYYGNGVPALSASMLSPTHVRADAAGNIYVYDNTNQIRRVNPGGIEVTVVSAANCGSDPMNYLCSVEGLALLGGGAVAFSDSKDDKLRKVDPASGTVTDVTTAALGRPRGIASSPSGFVYVADRGSGNNNGAIRKVSATTGAMTVIASSLQRPQYIAVDSAENVYFTSSGGSSILRILAGGSSASTYVTLTSAVTGLDADAAGNLFASDSNDQVWKITAGTASLYAGSSGEGLGDGGAALDARLSGPGGLSVVGTDLYVADALNYRIRLVRSNRAPTAAAGSDQTLEATAPSGTAVSLDGTASSDPDGDSLTYTWSGPFGSASGSSASVTLPLGTHTVTLTVSDGHISATDTLSVTVQDTIAPLISVVRSPMPNAHGWNNTDVTVAFTCSDSGSGSSFAAPPAPEVVASEGAGQSRSFSCSDAAGNHASLTVSSINIDKTPPSAVGSASPAANAAGWNNASVTVSFAGADTLSGLDGCQTDVVLVAEGAGQSASGTCTDRAGNVSTLTVVAPIHIDKTAPAATALRAPLANAYGWNNTDVTVTFEGLDGLSGIASCTAPALLSAEGAGQSATGSCTDVAGNASTTASMTDINIDKTAPVSSASASPSANAHGWNNSDVTVTFAATDGLSGVASCDPATVLSAEAAGQSASGNCMDAAGNSASATASEINIDKTAPMIAFSAATPAANAHGWNNSDVSISFTASDALSGIDTTSSSSPMILTAEGAAVSGSVDVSDLAGNVASFTSPVVQIDKTSPVVTGSRFPLANAHGWNNSDVTVSVSATDALSGVESCDADLTLSTEGASQSATRSCVDLAGNTASATVSEIHIDKTAPVSSASASPSANAHGWNNTDVTVTFAATDGLSGVESCDPAVLLSAEAAGQSASGSCMDLAGNSASATASEINIDKTMPALDFGAASPLANANGWNNTDVSFAFSTSDNLSGVDTTSVSSPMVLGTEGVSVSGSVDVTDLAGNTASFTSPVVQIDKTAPIVTGSRFPLANAHGWNNTDVTVSVSATDALSGVESCDADLTLSTEGASQSATRSCVDLAGNTASATVSEIHIDKTAPAPSATASPSANAHGWNNTDVTVTFAATDGLSGVESCDPAVLLSAEAAGQSASGSCMDLAGNPASATASEINIDKTVPALVFGAASPSANANGWNNTDVSFAFTTSDGLSGVDTTTVPSPLVLGTEGVSVSGSVDVTDLAGNTTSFTSPVVQIDKTAPVVTGSRAPLANAHGWNNTDVTVSVSATDALSGVASCESALTLSSEGASQSATRSCLDLAGNAAFTTVSGIQIDKTAPSVSASPARPADKNGWYNHAVSVSWNGSDPLSGVLSCAPASSYAGPDTLSASLPGQCSDRAGNQGSGSFALKYDATAPTVSIVTPPSGASYTLNQSVLAQYSCGDNLSGVDSCAGPVASGAAVSTTPIGAKTFKVSAMDAAGNAASATNAYAVQYKFVGFLQPVDNLPVVNLANAGRTIPIKWQLKDASGVAVSDLASAVSLLSAPLACDAAATDIIEEEAAATGGTQLRYEGGQFIFNWNTPKSWAGTCAQIQLTLADGTRQYAKFKFK